jgi:hypothetical protein
MRKSGFPWLLIGLSLICAGDAVGAARQDQGLALIAFCWCSAGALLGAAIVALLVESSGDSR